MQADNLSANGDEPPSGNQFQSLKEFHSAGRGFWRDVSEKDWNDWRWQLKHRITTPEQLAAIYADAHAGGIRRSETREPPSSRWPSRPIFST